MEGTKKQWESKGVIGAVITMLSLLAGAVGYTITAEDTQQMVVIVVGLVSSVGSVLSWVGRVKATKRIE